MRLGMMKIPGIDDRRGYIIAILPQFCASRRGLEGPLIAA
jgi:hypothetical protein